MSNHRVVAYAETLHRAYMKMETFEHFAKIALVTHVLGRQQPLAEENVQKLVLARVKYLGSSSVAPMRPDSHGGNHNGRAHSRHSS